MFNFKKHISIQDFLSLRLLISYEFSCSYELQTALSSLQYCVINSTFKKYQVFNTVLQTALSRNIKRSILCYKQHLQEISSLQYCVTSSSVAWRQKQYRKVQTGEFHWIREITEGRYGTTQMIVQHFIIQVCYHASLNTFES